MGHLAIFKIMKRTPKSDCNHGYKNFKIWNIPPPPSPKAFMKLVQRDKNQPLCKVQTCDPDIANLVMLYLTVLWIKCFKNINVETHKILYRYKYWWKHNLIVYFKRKWVMSHATVVFFLLIVSSSHEDTIPLKIEKEGWCYMYMYHVIH